MTSFNDGVDYAFEMYVRLFASALAHSDGLNAEMADRLREIAAERHSGNGYFSWDGILDDLTELTGDVDVAAEILNRA
jgi:hypothetical protein